GPGGGTEHRRASRCRRGGFRCGWAGARAVPMGPARTQAQSHPRRGTRVGDPRAARDPWQPGARRQTAWHHACRAQKTGREGRDFGGIEYQITDVTEPSLLLLIPAYNEERRLDPVLRDYARYFRDEYQGKFQLVVVLNGCVDDTIGVVRRVAAEFASVGA